MKARGCIAAGQVTVVEDFAAFAADETEVIILPGWRCVLNFSNRHSPLTGFFSLRREPALAAAHHPKFVSEFASISPLHPPVQDI